MNLAATKPPAQEYKGRCIIQMRSLRECLFYRKDIPGYSLDVFDLNDQCGIASLMINEQDDWYTDMPIAVVRSRENFWMAEFLGETEALGAYIFAGDEDYERLIAWLQARQRAPRVYLYTDFTPAGVEVAGRFLASITEGELYVPTGDLTSIWQAHGRALLFNQDQYSRLRSSLKVLDRASVQAVMFHLAKFQSGVELRSMAIVAKDDEAFH